MKPARLVPISESIRIETSLCGTVKRLGERSPRSRKVGIEEILENLSRLGTIHESLAEIHEPETDLEKIELIGKFSRN